MAALGADALPAGGLVAQTALLDNARDTPALEGTNTLAGYRRAFSRMQGALAQSLAGTATTALSASHRAVASENPQVLASLAAAPALNAMPERRDAAFTAAGMPRALPEGASTLAMAPLANAASAPEIPVLARTGEGEKAWGAVAEAWGSASHGLESAPLTEVGSSMVEPGSAEAEEALAEQVAYWVSENLQNAELTVTHDGKPVEVSVSLSGKEAHIVFGSDQSETRDLLDASVAQLRDLLHGEGLVLSGMTVGGAGARNAASEGGDTSRGRQGAKQTQVLAPAAEIGAVRSGIVTDRAVDVFV
ncbi:MAG: flagellar hook-length control protein FliK [Simplicispira sp.]|nr:flagellar hook-length control protein FliK [Simplicispira sp.]